MTCPAPADHQRPRRADGSGGSGGAAGGAGAAGRHITVGAARDQAGGSGRADSLAGGQDHDPLAVRLALLSVPHDQPAELDAAGVQRAGQLIASWRDQVARRAESPSRPVPAAVTRRLAAAFDRLDTGAALAVLRDLAALPDLGGDETVPAGAKFEAFAQADRILGLDLAREIGK